MKSPKPKKCRVCPTKFVPWNSQQVVCSPACSVQYAKEQEQKELRKWVRGERERLKTRSDWMREAQMSFNAWCRFRDRNQPCISCDKPATWQGQWHASHYRSRGSCPELRFHEDNVHKSCSECNGPRSGNIVEYRIRLIERIGPERLQELEGPHEPAKWTKDDLRAIRDHYRYRLRNDKRLAE